MGTHVETKEHIHGFLSHQIAAFVGKPELRDSLPPDQLIQEIGVDSVLLINLIVQIEMRFDIAFDDDELLLDNFATIHRIAGMITRKLEAGA